MAGRKAIDVAGDEARDPEDQQQKEDPAAKRAPVGRVLRIVQMDLVEGPLRQQHDAGHHQQQRPPMSVPLPEALVIQASGLYQQK